MIQITCTNCRALLQIDDAFAGGVCRCRHCGTIQTVPKRLKGSSNGDGDVLSEVAAGAGNASKTLWQKKGVEAAGSGTGLDDLAGLVASSGLTSGRLKKGGATRTVTLPPKKDNKTVVMLSVAGGVIALLLGVIVFMAVRDRTGGKDPQADASPQGTVPVTGPDRDTGATPPTPNSGNPPVAPLPAKITGPAFLGQPLNERSVVYVLDRGSSTATEQRLESLKLAVMSSVRSLGPQRKFAVMFWRIEQQKVLSYPAEGLKEATPQNIAELQKFLDEVYSFGQTHLGNTLLEKVLKTGTEAVVLVPVKAFLEGEPTQVTKARSAMKSNAKFYCFSLNQADLAPQLKQIAKDTKGTYRDVKIAELRAASGP